MTHTFISKIPLRLGKTKKDHKSGAKDRNFDNKQARVSWQQDRAATTANFPYHSCNGKRNHHTVSKRAK